MKFNRKKKVLQFYQREFISIIQKIYMEPEKLSQPSTKPHNSEVLQQDSDKLKPNSALFSQMPQNQFIKFTPNNSSSCISNTPNLDQINIQKGNEEITKYRKSQLNIQLNNQSMLSTQETLNSTRLEELLQFGNMAMNQSQEKNESSYSEASHKNVNKEISFSNLKQESMKVKQEIYKFCYTPGKPDTLVMLRDLNAMRGLFIDNQLPTQFVCLDEYDDSGWEETIQRIHKQTSIKIRPFSTLQSLLEYAETNKSSWLVVICSPFTTDEQYNKICKMPSTYMTLCYMPYPVPDLDTKYLINYKEDYKSLVSHIKQLNVVRTKEKKTNNFIFIDPTEVGTSHTLVRTMYSMLNQPIDSETNNQLVDQLEKLYQILNDITDGLYQSDIIQMHFFFNDLKKSTTPSRYIEWYTKEQICNFKIINSLLRSARHPSQTYYIQPYFKQLFNAIKDICINKSQKKNFECYRGARVSLQQFQRFKNSKNKVVLGISFLSTSLSKETAQKFGPCLIKIFVNQAETEYDDDNGYANITRNSFYSSEQEILFNPLSSFLIKEVYQNPNIIQLQYGVFSKIQQNENQQCTDEENILKMVGKLHRKYKNSCSNEGESLMNQEKYEKGYDQYWKKKISQQQKDQTSKQNTDYVTSLNNLAGFYENIGNMEQAEKNYKESLSILQKMLGKLHPNYATSLNNLAGFYYNIGNMEQAEKNYKESLNIRQKVLGKLHPDYATSLNNLAVFYQNIGNMQQAEKKYKESLNIIQKVLGKLHPDYATSLNNLAGFCQNIGNMEQAEKNFKESLSILQKMLGKLHPNYATSLNNLAGFYYNIGNMEQAEKNYKESLNIRQKVLGKLHPNYAQSLNNLAVFYQNIGNMQQAEKKYKESLNIIQKVLGKLHPDYATSLNNLAGFYQNIGNMEQAEKNFKESLNIRQKMLGKLHPGYATSLNNLAAFYKNIGNMEQAEKNYKESLNIRQKVLGKLHPDYATSLNNLAAFYKNIGNMEQAEKNYKESLNIRQKVLGKLHPNYAQSLNNLAVFYQNIGNMQQAEKKYKESLNIIQKVLGKLHPDYATSLNNLAAFYKNIGNMEQAEKNYKESLNIRQKVLGKLHPDYATSLNNLAAFYKNIGNMEQAEKNYKESLNIRQKVLGKLHPDYATSLNNLAAFYKNIGNMEQAEKNYKESLNIRQKVLGKLHPNYAQSLNNLAVFYQNIGNMQQAEKKYKESLNIIQKVLGKLHPDYATSLNNLAGFYQNIGNMEQAEKNFKESLNIRQKVLGKLHPNYAQSLNNLAVFYQNIGNMQQAEKKYKESLNIIQKVLGKLHPDYATSLNNLSVLYQKSLKLELSLVLIKDFTKFSLTVPQTKINIAVVRQNILSLFRINKKMPLPFTPKVVISDLLNEMQKDGLVICQEYKQLLRQLASNN